MYNRMPEPYDPFDDHPYIPSDLASLRRNEQIAEQFLFQDIQEEYIYRNQPGVNNQVNEILSIFLTRHQDILELVEDYGVPRRISRLLTRRIIRFVLDNAAQIPGSPGERVQVLYSRFISADRVVVPVLRLFNVPENVIGQYIRRVIRVTLRNISTIPPLPPPPPNVEAQVSRILADFERQHPDFLGLTTVYRIPTVNARAITREIIRFTLLNVNRIPSVGTIERRSREMLELLDAEFPQPIQQMIRRGVPAGQAEEITRRIIAFTLNSIR